MKYIRTKNEIKSFKKYDGNPDNFTTNDYCNANNDELYAIRKICNKLGQLEDIEDELGIDLITFVKAITQGFYVKSNDFMKAHYHFSPCLFKTNSDYERANEYIIEYGKDFVFLKDYGKTWALTREELE